MSPPPGFGDDFGELFGGTTSPSVQALITKCLTAVGVNPDDSDYRDRTLVFLNFAYLKILKGRHWKFTHREAFVDLRPPYEVGTVALTQGSGVVEEDTVPAALQFNIIMVGQTFAPSQSDQDLYRVNSILTSKKLALTSNYAGETAAGSAYKILFDRLVLEAGIQAVRSLLVTGLGELKPCGVQEFRNKKGANPNLVGPPEWYTLVNAEKDSGQWTLEIWPAPDKRYSAQIDYTLRPVGLVDEDTSFTLIPPNNLDVLYYAVVADLYGYQENGAMADRVGKIAALSWNTFASDQEMTDSVARIQPGRRYFNRRRDRYAQSYGLKWFGRVDD
jgi:hypothetical protein